MNVKKLLRTALIVVCITLSMPAISNAMTPETDITAPAKTDKTVDIMVRLQEIKDMDKSGLSRTEKKDLRKEVKEMRHAIKTSKNGVYLSVGAIIIIILLLILLT